MGMRSRCSLALLSVALLQSRCDIDHLEDLKRWQG